jgi:hypothetical protein
MSTVVTLRLPDDTAKRLQARARRTGRSVSELGARSIEEWLRQDEFADIEFRTFGDQRHACLKASLPIWQVMLVAQSYAIDAEQTAAHFGWPVRRIQAAFNYYHAFSDEIDQVISDNRAATFEQLRRSLPSLERFVVPDDNMAPS